MLSHDVNRCAGGDFTVNQMRHRDVEYHIFMQCCTEENGCSQLIWPCRQSAAHLALPVRAEVVGVSH